MRLPLRAAGRAGCSKANAPSSCCMNEKNDGQIEVCPLYSAGIDIRHRHRTVTGQRHAAG